VVGVAGSIDSHGQNLNFAIPGQVIPLTLRPNSGSGYPSSCRLDASRPKESLDSKFGALRAVLEALNICAEIFSGVVDYDPWDGTRALTWIFVFQSNALPTRLVIDYHL
jgi:hypothetical protein